MMTKKIFLPVFVLMFFMLAGHSFAGELRTVKKDVVCMVANRVSPEPPFPVKADNGLTYQVCCDNCAARILGDKNMRVAQDPVSGKKIDKSKAVILALPDDSILYFESKKTAKEFADYFKGHSVKDGAPR